MIYPENIKDFVEQALITPDKHHSIYDYSFQTHLSNAPWKEWLSKPNYFNVKEEFISKMHQWISSSKENAIIGLENFKRQDVIIGTTQTFDDAYYMHNRRRLRVFSNEYRYHYRNIPDLKFLDINVNGDLLDENDWVILSNPFSGTGNTHSMQTRILQEAEKKNVPVIVDAAWFGTCGGITIDVTSPAIESISFSLSKGIGLGDMRIGLRYSNLTGGSVFQQNNFSHLVASNMQIGIYQMAEFSPDFIYKKYSDSYIQTCNMYNFSPTKCLHVAYLNNQLIGIRNLVKCVYKNSINKREQQ